MSSHLHTFKVIYVLSREHIFLYNNNDYIHIPTVHVSTSISFFPRIPFRYDDVIIFSRRQTGIMSSHFNGILFITFFATAAACVYTFKLRELIRLICGSIMPFYTHVQCYIW